MKILELVGLGCENFRIGLGYESKQSSNPLISQQIYVILGLDLTKIRWEEWL